MTNEQRYIDEAVSLYGKTETLPGYPSSTYRDIMQITWYALNRWGVAPVKAAASRGHSYRVRFFRDQADVIVRINDYNSIEGEAFTFQHIIR